jgi:hypothetical protein
MTQVVHYVFCFNKEPSIFPSHTAFVWQGFLSATESASVAFCKRSNRFTAKYGAWKRFFTHWRKRKVLAVKE